MVLVSRQALVIGLSYAGILPMALSLVFISDPVFQTILKFYSLGILCFVAGSWWGIALVQSDQAQVPLFELVSSNVLTLLAIGAVLMLDSAAFLALAVLFLVLYLGEARLDVFKGQPHYYRRMRRRVSGMVVFLHLTAYLFLLPLG